MPAGRYKFSNGHVPGFASSYVVVRREGGIKLGAVAQNAGQWIVKCYGDLFFFNTREDAAQALDMADRAAHPAPAPSQEETE